MKLFFFLFALFLTGSTLSSQTYPHLNINLLGHIDPETDNTGSDGRKYSGCWGWYQQAKGREYALCGTSSGTYFVDITTPTNPVVCDYVKGAKAGCTWRELKSYDHYCYIVSDDAPPNTFQIVDMQYLPDSVHVVYDGTSYFEQCHTIFIDNGRLYCGSVTPAGGIRTSMHIYSLANPEVPVLLRRLTDDVPVISDTHDMFVRNDTIFASCAYQGLYILKYFPGSNVIVPQAVIAGYPQSGYNHSSWVTQDRKTMVFADEVPAGLSAKVFDISDFSNITFRDTIRSHVGATAHNPYIIGNRWCWMSTYQDGLYLYDISNPLNTSIYGYFDTQPQHGVNDNFSTDAYRGNWGAYPFLPSKVIIAQDMQNGIFILDGDAEYKSTTSVQSINGPGSYASVYPNPAQTQFILVVANQQKYTLSYMLSDVLGNTVRHGLVTDHSALAKEEIDVSDLANGCYVLTLTGGSHTETKKLVISH